MTETRSGTVAVAGEFVFYAGGLAVSAAVQFVSLAVFTRSLGATQYGLYATAMAVAGAAGAVALFGADLVLARNWFGQPDATARRDLARTWLTFVTLWSVPVLGVAALLWTSTNQSAGLVFWALGTALIGQVGRLIAQVLRNTFQVLRFVLTSIIVSLVAGIAGLVLVLGLGWGAQGVIAGLLAGEAVGLAVRFWWTKDWLVGHWRPGMLPPLVRMGLPLIPATLALWALNGLDRIVISARLGLPAAGAYSVASALASPFALLGVALGQAWVPRIAQRYEADPEGACATTARNLVVVTAAMGALAAVLGLLAGPLVALFAGSGYDRGALALPALAAAGALMASSALATTGYTLARSTAAVPVVVVAAALIGGGTMLLGAGAGIQWVAIAVALSAFIYYLGSFVVSQRALPIPARPWRIVAQALVILICGCGLGLGAGAWLGVTAAAVQALVAVMAMRRGPSISR